MSQEAPRGPGRPRDADMEDRVYTAVLEVYWETSWRGFTFDAVARRAKVGRAALYRRWADKEALLVQALEARSPLSTPIDTGSVRGDLVELAEQLAVGYGELSGLVSLRVTLDARVNPDLLSHLTDTLNQSRLVTTRRIVRRAIARGELPEGTSTTLLLELVTGAVLARALFSQAHTGAGSRAAVNHSKLIVDTVLRALSQLDTERPTNFYCGQLLSVLWSAVPRYSRTKSVLAEQSRLPAELRIDVSEVVLTEVRGHTLVVTINRPEAANSINADVHRGLGAAWDRAQNSDDIRVVVLTGAGDKTFCAGADLKALGTSGPAGVTPPETSHWGFAGIVKHHIAKPVISAVNGSALGGGTELALAGDLVVAAENSTFGLPEVKRGLIAGAGGVFRLTAAIPRGVAMELLLTGAAMSAQDALRWGLVNRVVPSADVLSTALALADVISANAPLAVQASKRVARGICDGMIAAEDRAWELSEQALESLSRSADTVEGVMAFIQKRDPIWSGK